jgi:acetyl esterase/lipase
MAFNAMGYHAFVLRYSVYAQGKPFVPAADMQPKRHCQFPNPTIDIARALWAIGKKADEWRVDMQKIALCGFSAGAHNCAMYSVYWNKPLITDAAGGEISHLRPAACILGYTISDYIFMKRYIEKRVQNDSVMQELSKLSQMAYIGIRPLDDALGNQISPARQVDCDTPPMFLWATSEDAMAPVQNSILMASALADNGIPFEMHIFEKGPHALSTATQASAGNTAEMDSAAAKWIGLCRTWLDKRFAFNLPGQPPAGATPSNTYRQAAKAMKDRVEGK